MWRTMAKKSSGRAQLKSMIAQSCATEAASNSLGMKKVAKVEDLWDKIIIGHSYATSQVKFPVICS